MASLHKRVLGMILLALLLLTYGLNYVYCDNLSRLMKEANLAKGIVLSLRKELITRIGYPKPEGLKLVDSLIKEANKSLDLANCYYVRGDKFNAIKHFKQAMRLYSRALEIMVKISGEKGVKPSSIRWSVTTEEDLKVAYEVARNYLNELKAMYKAVIGARTLNPRLSLAIGKIMEGIESLLSSGLESLSKGNLNEAKDVINLVYDMLSLVYNMISKPR